MTRLTASAKIFSQSFKKALIIATTPAHVICIQLRKLRGIPTDVLPAILQMLIGERFRFVFPVRFPSRGSAEIMRAPV